MLYRDIAPVSNDAWKEIDERAVEVLKSYLSARKVVHVVGPKGLEYNAVPGGRLTNVQEEDGVCFGNYQVVPLTETRVEFEMDRWELDNVERGAKDVDYEPLEEAMKKIAIRILDVPCRLAPHLAAVAQHHGHAVGGQSARGDRRVHRDLPDLGAGHGLRVHLALQKRGAQPKPSSTA